MEIDKLPSFFIIGAMKAATSTLWKQLSEQSGIFLCTPKEPNFFSDNEQYQKGIKYYKNLFCDAKHSDLIGESSTHYTKLPTYSNTISRLKQNIKDPIFIYIMRHPVDRLISHYTHEWSQNNISCDINKAVQLHPELQEYSCYFEQLKPYFGAFGKKRILPVFFDHLKESSQTELERICKFIGYSEKPKWHDFPSQNVSSARIRQFPFYDFIINSPVASRIRHTLVPKSIRNRIKRTLTMTERPVLSDTVRKQIETHFDADLSKLSEHLEVELTCSNFKQIVSNNPIDWC